MLHWINSSKQLKPFVNTRVSEILSAFPASCWQYCPSSDNPADLLTRGITSQQLAISTTWKHGPVWLTSKSQWPTWHPTEVLHSHHPEVIAVLTVEEAETTDPEMTHNKSTSEHGLHHILNITILPNFSV